MSGYLQADAVAWSQESVDEVSPSSGESLNEERVLIRRGRLRADAAHDIVSGSLELDGNTVDGATARIVSAEATVSWPAGGETPLVAASLGLMKIPFGAEVPLRDRDRPFLETSNAARALFPGNYDAGLRVFGGWRFLRYSLAAMNGAPVGDAQFRGHDPSERRDLIGRLGVDVAITPCARVVVGASGLSGTGFHPGDPASKDELVWIDNNEDGMVQTSEIVVVPGRPATPSETFDRHALGGDAAAAFNLRWLGWLTVSAEAVVAENLDRGLMIADPVSATRDLREVGWSVGVVQELTRHAMAGIRYDRYDPDRDASEARGAEVVPVDARYSTLSIMGAWRWRDRARFTLEYDHNDNPLGRSDSGEPTRLAADRVTLRGQVSF